MPGSAKRDPILKSIVRYASSSVYQHVLGVFTAFIKPRLLLPDQFGLLNILTIIPTYAAYSNLGTYDITRYKVPYHEARGEEARSLEIQDSVFFGTLAMNLLIVFGLVSVALLSGYSRLIRVSLLIVSLTVVVQWYHDNYVLFLKARLNFTALSSSIYLKATSALLFTALLILAFGIYGALLAPVAAILPVLLYLRSRHPMKRRTVFRPAVFRALVREGLPIMLYNFSGIALATADRIVIAALLGNEQLGYYGIAVMVSSFMRQIPGTAREVLEPNLMQDLDRQSREENLRTYLFRPLVSTAYLMPFLVGPVVFGAPVLIPLLLPKYIPGIAATQIIVFGCYFLALTFVTRGIIVAHGWQGKAALLVACILIVNASLSVGMVRMGWGINGVAVSSSLSQMLMLAASILFLRLRCRYAFPDWRQTIRALCLALAVMSLSILIIFQAVMPFLEHPFVQAAVGLLAFSLIMGVNLWHARKHNPLLQRVSLRDF